ncbi:hypothetical protein BWGOE8_31180 [Bacillus mycoides]|uniref:Uncharacterized protein n=1 Tax=Bacillus mycoides TaxID=1405 RepID=A0A1E8B5S6_BACMY|nr:hypothetical protein BWGOE8_31180 [Bacillus mycoides]OFD77759.1 hypothetical protein BWGOE9_31240 [Bacillus mycoides]OFD79114.1 hypothetical protein BWGOE10_31810 [Bacillus mycoides]
MSIISDELYLFAQELQTFVSPTALQEIAKQVDFVQRLSKYHADELIVLCAWNSQEIASTSLTQYRPFMTKKPIYVSFEIEPKIRRRIPLQNLRFSGG